MTPRPAAPRRAASAGICAALLLSAAPGWAQSGSGAASGDDAPAIHFTLADRPTLHLGSLGEIRFRGRVESTIRTPQADEGLASDFRWQTRRLQIEGTVFKRLEFEVSREFGDADEPERDAFVNLRVARAFELQAGRFKVPFGRDALTGGANLDFVYRSLAGRQIAPGRDVGVMVHGRLRGRALAYEAGYFLHDGDNARTSQTRGGRDAAAGRVLVTPFARSRHRALTALQVGAAAVTSQLDTQLGLRGRTVFGDGVFFDRVFVNGRRLRRGLEAAWNSGPVSISWEHVTVTDPRLGMGPDGETLPGVRGTGWYVAGTWTVTGEPKRGRLEPRTSVLNGGRGAIEVMARIERLAFGEADEPTDTVVAFGLATPANAERVTTIGTAWHLARYLKLQANAVFESVRDPQRSPAPRGGGRFPSIVVQLQFAL